jgi:hypothetical protein
MTSKEIAEAVEKDERTIQRWIKRVGDKVSSIGDKMSSSSPMKPADYSLEESIIIIEHGMGKNAASLFRENARLRDAVALRPPASSEMAPLSAFAEVTHEMMLILQQMREMMKNIIHYVTYIETQHDTLTKALPIEAPQMEPRANINRIVRRYAEIHSVPQGTAWNNLYREFGYRMHMNPKVAAGNRGVSPLNYIESLNLMGTLEAVAIEWGDE